MIKSLKSKKLILAGIFLLSSVLSYSFRLEDIVYNERMDGEAEGYKEFEITNNALEKARYRVTVLDGTKNSGASFMEVSPKVVVIEAKSSGVIKAFAKVPEGVENGEYDFKLEFTPINIPTLAKAKEKRIGGTSKIDISPVIPMKGYVGEVDFAKALRFEDIKVEADPKGGVVVTGLLSNDSYAGIDFGAEAYGRNDYFYDSTYVADLPGHSKNKKIKLYFSGVQSVKSLKKIIFYRTPSRTRKIIKTIDIVKKDSVKKKD